MPQVTVVFPDRRIIVDGEVIDFPADLPMPQPGSRALQWTGTAGELELPFESRPIGWAEVEPYVALHAAERQRQTAAASGPAS